MFERPHHRRVVQILRNLDAPLLLGLGCLFGGGTAIALRHGEFRESVDIDFLVSDLAGYRELRQRLNGPDGIQAIASAGAMLHPLRELRVDQYGIRTVLEADGEAIKIEVVLEARMTLDAPGPEDSICGVATLAPIDMATSKLLANSDNWADDSVFSRDLIDLAMMQPAKRLLQEALRKARSAYGESIGKDLARAVDRLLVRQGRIDVCRQAMQMTMPPAQLRQRIKQLAARSQP